MSTRINKRFADLKAENRAGLVTFVMAGDPDHDTAMRILNGLPGAGADLIELGMPFTDPMADGPAIQVAGLRALENGASLRKTLEMVREFRKSDPDTPIILMGYYNPVFIYGVEQFSLDAREAGVDGLIIVDIPPEEADELTEHTVPNDISLIRLATPTTDDKRLPTVLDGVSGFVYYVSFTGITGAASLDTEAVANAVARLKRHTGLPIAVGFGIKTPDQAAAVARCADAAVVGSALVQKVTDAETADQAVDGVLDLVKQLADGVRNARAK